MKWAMIFLLLVLLLVTRSEIVEVNKKISLLEPLLEMECEKIIPYRQFGRHHIVCWNGHLEDHTSSERAVIRQWHAGNNLPQPKQESYSNRE